jgi:hypothetical protein
MNIADELRKLQDLHQSGALTDDEFATAKAAVLSGRGSTAEPAKDQVMQEHLEEIKLQNEVARIDREWGMERERYMVAGGRYGQRYVPNRPMSVVGGIIIVGFGIFWTVMAASIAGGFGGGPAAIFPCFGILFILAGVAMSIYSYSKAVQYEQAYEAYRRRRGGALAGAAPQPPVFQPPPANLDTAVRADEVGEPIQCLKCGQMIPAETSQCPHCGWSYSKA